MEKNYKAIVIGGGMTGSFAAKEFCDQGMKTLILERGREVVHGDYPTTNLPPWELDKGGRVSHQDKVENPIINRCYAYSNATEHLFVKDTEHPYVEEAPFDWIRGYQVGGKSLMWARQVQRWSDFDFEGPKRDKFAVDWPIRYKDLAEWYSHVERFIGVSGNKDGLEELPDGEFLKPWDMNCMELYFQEKVAENYTDRKVIYGRCAHLTETTELIKKQGRGLCQNRTICERGCPYGGYFSANSSLIPWAKKTGNLTIRPHSVVHSIIYDDEKGKAVGVKVIDAKTMEEHEFFADVIFVNAATLNTNLILLNSKSERFPNGLGNDNGLLGKYVGFHNYKANVTAEYEGLEDTVYKGRRPTSAYIPRFKNLKKQDTDYLRGYASGFSTYRFLEVDSEGDGEELLNNLMAPKKYSTWRVRSWIMGETIPKESCYVALDEEKKDKWGIPQLRINVTYDENDHKMTEDFLNEFAEMFEKAGFTNISKNNTDRIPGLDIHEMGGVRMGKDPETSLLNEWNQMHLCKNVFVTDGACMTSFSTQNPSLTFMAITARAANYAIEQLKKGTEL